ncbi:MAG: hypothetical protein KatS3mg031_0641 [Chitinophagales bacterium]|nr:MAG: hypothetical protein KatS3mg031_0641 [Chitinophagales bacterium]
MLTKEDLLKMNNRQLFEVMLQGYALAPEQMAGKMYLGIDLSLPPLLHKILWRTFRKTFFRDPESGRVRGWNVRIHQTGIEPPSRPLLNKREVPVTFGHYELREAAGKKFPRGWRGSHYLDYTVAGNKWFDPARLGYCPLVAVNRGSMDLLLGWEVLKTGTGFLPLPDFWLLQVEGPLDYVAPRPGK